MAQTLKNLKFLIFCFLGKPDTNCFWWNGKTKKQQNEPWKKEAKKKKKKKKGPGLKKYRLFAKNLFKTSRFWVPGQAASTHQKFFSHRPKLEILIDPGSASNFIKASSHMLEHFSLWTRKPQTLKPTQTFLICGGGCN